MSANSEIMLVAGRLGESSEMHKQKAVGESSLMHKQKADVVTDSNRFILLECEIESEKRHFVSGELLVREDYPSCKSEENVIIEVGASLGNNEMEDVLAEMVGNPEKVLVSGTPDDSSELRNTTTLSSIEPLDGSASFCSRKDRSVKR